MEQRLSEKQQQNQFSVTKGELETQLAQVKFQKDQEIAQLNLKHREELNLVATESEKLRKKLKAAYEHKIAGLQ